MVSVTLFLNFIASFLKSSTEEDEGHTDKILIHSNYDNDDEEDVERENMYVTRIIHGEVCEMRSIENKRITLMM